jgi:hypothetical protein
LGIKSERTSESKLAVREVMAVFEKILSLDREGDEENTFLNIKSITTERS